MKVLDDLDMNNNQILNSVIHTTVVDPPDEDGRKAGKMIYNSTEKKLKYSDGDVWYVLKTNDEISLPYCNFVGGIEADSVTGEGVIKELIKYDSSNGSNFENWLTSFKKQNGYNAYDSISPFTIVYTSDASMQTIGSTTVEKTTKIINVQCKLLSKTEEIIYTATSSGESTTNSSTIYYYFQMNVIDSSSKQTEAIIELAKVNKNFQYPSVKAYIRTITDYKSAT